MYRSEPPSSTRQRAQEQWQRRRAREPRPFDSALLALLVGFGVASALAFFDYWFQPKHVGELWVFILLSLAFVTGIAHTLLGYLPSLHLNHEEHVDAPSGLRVAVFVTAAPGDPLAMVERTLAALEHVRYPHTTYLLDGTDEPCFYELAGRRGATWLDMTGVSGAKAGKVNRALALTDEDFVLVLDPDHVPFPEFFDRVLGHFRDEGVGFVQVSQAYYNQDRSFVARAAAEQTYGFYGPMQAGHGGHGSAFAIGANCTFRRKALDAIGGHAVALAEDLVTSIRIHAAGYRSVYVPEILSRGLVPEDLGAYFAQQLKWATGATDMFFEELVRLWPKLSLRQRATYFAVGTYYTEGFGTATYWVLPYLAIWFGVVPARVDVSEFVAAGAPVLLAPIALHLYGQRFLCDPRMERGLHLRAMLLKLLCFPVHLVGAVRALLGSLVQFLPTPKRRTGRGFFALVWPHVATLAVFLSTLAFGSYRRLSGGLGEVWLGAELFWGMLSLALVSALLSAGGLLLAYVTRRHLVRDAWSLVPPDLRQGGAT
jgi:cellulose synthase (UDP-forming)